MIKNGRMISFLLIGLLLMSPLQSLTVMAEAMTEEELPEGVEIISSIMGGALKPGSEAYGEMETVAIEGQPFTTALRFTTSVHPANTYDIQYEIPISAPIEKDDVLLASFYARTISSTHETGEGTTAFVMERRGTWDKSINQTEILPIQWKKLLVPIKAALLMEENTPQVAFRLGYKAQVVEIADLKIVNYKKAVSFEDLPSTPVTYDGMEEDAPWRAEANQRIEQIRKGDLEIEVIDQDGNPIQAADVHVEMTKHDFRFGTAVNNSMIMGTDENAAMYRTKLKENFNSVVMENEMKWAPWESDKARTVNLYNWLGENGFDIRGHALLWDGSTRMPPDIGDILEDRASLDKRIKDHFHELAGYFRGRLFDWDVVNEPVLNRMIRSEYGDAIMADWLKLAKEADPYAKLFVNETQILGVDAPVIGTFSNLLQVLKDNNAPIDGIGIQAHFGSTPVSPMAFYDQLTHFTQYAPEIAITEFDFNTSREDVQAQFTHDLLMATFSHPNVSSFTMWGFWDGAHWQNNAPLFRADWSLKPSGEEWRELIYETWWTDVEGATDSDGLFNTRGFYGDYDITVTHSGTSQTVKTSLVKSADNKVTVVWGQPAEEPVNTFSPLPIPAQDSDITAPVWPYGSVFGASEASPTSVTLAWPNAHDNEGVSSYSIYRDGSLIAQVPSNVTSYDVVGLTPGQSYSFTIEAEDSQGNRSVSSPEIQSDTSSGSDSTLPRWKKGSFLNVSELSQTGAQISWPAVMDSDVAMSYRVYVNGQIVDDTDETNFAITGLTENHLYTVRVEAKDGVGNLSQGGPIVAFRTLGAEDTTAPIWSDPSDFTASEITSSSVVLDWSPAQDAKGVLAYRLFRGDEELVTLPASTRSFQVNGLSSNSTYSFKVEAGDSQNNWSVTGSTLTIKTNADADSLSPSWPANKMLTYGLLSDKSVSLNWTAATDNIEVTAYRVYANDTIVASVNGNEHSFTVPDLVPGQSYVFLVEAGDAAGNWTTGPSVAVTTFSGVIREQHVLNPSDDAFIQAPATFGGDGTTNNLNYLRFKNAAGASGLETTKNTGFNRRVYLKFPLNTVTGSVYEATLNLYVFAVQSPNKDISMDLYATGDSWVETGINWNNKPADSAKLSTTIARNAGYWKTFTVTDYAAAELSGDQVISFKLTDDSWVDQNVDIHSKEAANAALRPTLVIGTEGVPTDEVQPVWTADMLAITNVKPHAATLTWSGASDQIGINQYVVYQNDVAIATVGSDVYSYEVTGLNPSTSYTFKIEARDAEQESVGGPTQSLTTPAGDGIAPAWPGAAVLTSQDVSRFAATLQWTPAEDNYGVMEYVIYNGDVPVATIPGNLLSYRVSGLTAGTAYSLSVTARDEADNESSKLSSLVTTLAADTSSPQWSEGSLLTASEVSSSGIMLNWSAAIDDTGVSQYHIYRDGTKVSEVTNEITSYYMTGLDEDTAYTFMVSAVDEADNLSLPLKLGPISTLKQDTITPQWPTGSRITATLKSDHVILQWDAAVDNLGIKSYLVYQDGELVAVVEWNTTRYTIMETANASTVYKVEAQDDAGNSTVFELEATAVSAGKPGGGTPGGTPGGGIGGGGGTLPANAQEAIDKVKEKLDDLFGDGTPGKSNNDKKNANKAVEKAIKEAANLDVSSGVTVKEGVAKLEVNLSQLSQTFKSVKDLAKQANDALKGKDSNAVPAKVVATLNLGTVKADNAQIPISQDLLKAAKENGIDSLAISVNGITMEIDVNEFDENTTLEISNI